MKYVILGLLLLTPVFGFNDGQYISESNLSNIEKMNLIANLEPANHDVVRKHNLNVKFNSTDTHSSGIIQDAWLKIFSILPSVQFNNTLYVNSSSQILVGHNYKLSIPEDYSSPKYPNTNAGDCKRTYKLVKESSIASINNKPIETYSNLSDGKVKATYEIAVDLEIKKFAWKRYCCRYNNGVCSKHCYNCKLASTNTQKDKLSLTDEIEVKRLPQLEIAEAKLVNEYADNYIIKIPSSQIKLSLVDSSYTKEEYAYEINVSPDNFYTLVATKNEKEQLNNLFKENDSIIVSNPNQCEITFSDFFNSITQPCNLAYEDVFFKITTDKLLYNKGEIINIIIYPEGLPVNITYENTIIEASRNVSFIADKDIRITANYNNKKTEALIQIIDKDNFGLLYSISAFGFINYVIYIVLKKYAGGLL